MTTSLKIKRKEKERKKTQIKDVMETNSEALIHSDI